MHSSENELNQLPIPDAHALEHSERLRVLIRDEVDANGGSLSFSRFMELALYAPGLGYYSAGSRKFGEAGDFITAPEVSPLFGRCMANFCRQVLTSIPDGKIIEFGAGSGVMAADILSELEARNALPSSYWILEVSAELRQRQQQTLQKKVPHLLERVQWLDSLPEQGFEGVVLANELLDAMPVHRFRVEDGEVKELCVGWSEKNDAFVMQTQTADKDLQSQLMHIQKTLGTEFPESYESEVSLMHTAWLKSVQECMRKGVVLLVDYGYGRAEYYHPDRHMGTLMCHYRHRAHSDPFLYPGLQDITAYVDFTTVAEAAVDNSMDVLGYTAQCGFLLGNGLDGMMPDPEKVTQQALLSIAQQVKTLTLPSEMGERFKVIALGKDFDEPVPGFDLQDQRGRL